MKENIHQSILHSEIYISAQNQIQIFKYRAYQTPIGKKSNNHPSFYFGVLKTYYDGMMALLLYIFI